MAEEEGGDMTVIDVLNTNQRLRQNEGLGTELSISNDQSSSGGNKIVPEGEERGGKFER